MKKVLSKNMLIYGAFAVAAITALAACNGDDVPPSGYAQVVYKNGNVLTANKDAQVVQAVAVKDRKVVAAGSDKELSKYIGKNTAVSNLKCNTREFNERLRSGGDLPRPGPRFVVESSSPVSGVAWC